MGTNELHPSEANREAYASTLLNILSLLMLFLFPLAWYEMTECLWFPFAHGVHSTNNVTASLRHHLKFEMLNVVQKLILDMTDLLVLTSDSYHLNFLSAVLRKWIHFSFKGYHTLSSNSLWWSFLISMLVALKMAFD